MFLIHISRARRDRRPGTGGIERMAEVVARGAACTTDLLLGVDFFQHASEAPGENSHKICHTRQEPENSRARSVRGYEVAIQQLGQVL
jgi:hypothetical protein